ncbi:MAG: class 3 adenylate cyclase/HAMP domain-containing protein [Nitrospinales bacterium]|jgi:class 3 adenylate cyclase/HAMP domain-containing protein
MTLSAKIFFSFFFFSTLLLGLTLYISNSETEQYEIKALSSKLRETHQRFDRQLDQERLHILKIAQTLTTDQKFRSFLSQIKDNFFSFAEEIAHDTDADLVFMVDDHLKVRGMFPTNEKLILWVNANLDKFPIKQILETGSEKRGMISTGGKLMSSVGLPLKESLRDEYALGAMVIVKNIDDKWVAEVTVDAKGNDFLQVIFFSDLKIVADNVEDKFADEVIASLEKIPSGSGMFLFEGDRYLTKRGFYEHDDKTTGYLYATNLDSVLKPFRVIQDKILITGIAILTVGLLFSIFFSRRIAQPLGLLLQGTKGVIDDNYDFEIKHTSKDEVGELSKAFNHMLIGLREKKYIQETFGKYVHPSIVAEILSNPEKIQPGGKRSYQSVLFCDVANFTSFSETMEPEALIKLLNEYLGAMTEEISNTQGILDKYIGDAIMAFWGPPFTPGNHSLLACQAAINMQNTLQILRPKWLARGLPEIRIRVGIATGHMIVGNIGSEKNLEYTCIGDTVNYSSRLEGINKVYGTDIIIDLFTKKSVEHDLLLRELDTIQVKGRGQGSQIFEVIAEKKNASEYQKQLKSEYESTLEIYRKGEFMLAEKEFSSIYKASNDLASKTMSERCRDYIIFPPEDWSGIAVMKEK